MNTTPRIDVYFDLICPWCLIGKRHLASTLQHLRKISPGLQPQVIWHSFPLLPDTPLNGLPYQEFYERRLGGPDAVAARRAQVKEAGKLAGVEFAFERITCMPNTLAAHGLIDLATKAGDERLVESLIEALFQAYFMDARDIGNLAVLIDIAGKCGLAVNLQQLAAVLAQPIPKSVNQAVSGVPYYVFNGRLALSGVHPPATLLKYLLHSIT